MDKKRPPEVIATPGAKKSAKNYSKDDIIKGLKNNEIQVGLPSDKKSSIWKKFGHPIITQTGEVLKTFMLYAIHV